LTQVNLRNADGDVVYDEKRKPKKTKIKMTNGFFAGSNPQDFYFGPEPERTGVFKGMAVILKERGHDITYTNGNRQVKELAAQCPGFKCPHAVAAAGYFTTSRTSLADFPCLKLLPKSAVFRFYFFRSSTVS
jgi:hypothetical protein